MNLVGIRQARTKLVREMGRLDRERAAVAKGIEALDSVLGSDDRKNGAHVNWSAERRRAQSRRMKAFWANRKRRNR